MCYLKIKRMLDIVLSIIALIILFPLFFVLILAIKIDSKGPIFFKQKRVGVHKTYFNILKFRTMKIDTPKESPTHLLENPEQWITKVGRVLRKTSLDELPQLINIIKGEMSIIGPRPALWNQYDLIQERDIYNVNDVLPGLTGWAQINGRDELPIGQKAKLDGEYVEKMSFTMDAKCFLKTLLTFMKGNGVVEGSNGKIDQNDTSNKRDIAG